MFRQAKRRSRIDRNAISGPMGDFRHTMHIGRGGDAFGDTSFLATPKPVTQSSSADPLLGADGSTIDGFTHPTADTVLPVRSGSECSSNSRSNESLPMVNQPQITRTLNGHSKGHRNSGSDVESYDNYMCVATQPAATSTSPSVSGDPMLSFDLDLGPSMLDDILSVMNRGSLMPTDQVPMESDVLQSQGSTCSDARPSRPKLPSARQSEKVGGDVESELPNRRPERCSPSAPRNWNYDSGFESTTSPSDVRPQPKPRTVRTELVWEHGGVQKTPHRKVLSASCHLSSGSSVESGATPWEDGRHKMSSDSFDKASDEEVGEQFAFEDDDDDDEIRV